MRDFDIDPLADFPKLSPQLIDKLARIVVWMVLGRSALMGIFCTAALAILSLFITIPFSPMWGFTTVFLGGAFALFLVKRLKR